MIQQFTHAVRGYAADVSGIVRAGQWSSATPTILMYHRVGPAEGAIGPEACTVSRDELAADLDRLTTHATVVPLARLVDWLDGNGTLPADAVVLTFDDGYRDITTTVVPLLERYEAPATVYVSAGCVENRQSPFAFRLLAALRERDSVPTTGCTLPANGPLPRSGRGSSPASARTIRNRFRCYDRTISRRSPPPSW